MGGDKSGNYRRAVITEEEILAEFRRIDKFCTKPLTQNNWTEYARCSFMTVRNRFKGRTFAQWKEKAGIRASTQNGRNPSGGGLYGYKSGHNPAKAAAGKTVQCRKCEQPFVRGVTWLYCEDCYAVVKKGDNSPYDPDFNKYS